MDAATLRRNAQLKAASTVITNLGSALIAAGAARWFAFRVDPLAPVWLLAAAMIIWAGIYMLRDLEAEQADGAGGWMNC